MVGETILTGLVVAHNEEENLEACLVSLGFCDQLVVVLDRCTDKSELIAKKFGAKILKGSWPIEGDRRNQGIQACDGQWILEIDADERVPKNLASEINDAIQTADGAMYFSIPVDNYIGNKLVRCGWGAYFGVSSVKRLFKKGCKTWGRQRVHPIVSFEGKEGKRLNHRLQHYVDRDITDLFERLNRYSTARAKDLLDSGDLHQETLFKNVRRLVSRFYKCYIRRKGYREGKWGVLVALCAAMYPVMSYLKATLEPSVYGRKK